MAMGIVSDKEFESEKNNSSSDKPREDSNSSPKPAVIIDVNKGRGKGSVEVPNSLRNVIGQTAITDGRSEALQLAESFGISPSSVSAYTNGATSTASIGDKPNDGVIGKAKTRIATRARAKLMLALSKITDDKLAETKPRDLAGIAKDMAIVMKSMEDNVDQSQKGNNGPNFIFYSPQIRNEKVFDVIQVKE